NPATLTSLTFSPNSVVGGTNTSGGLTLNGKAGPSGIQIVLTGGSSKVQIESPMTINPQTKMAAFTTVTGGVSTLTNVVPTAKQGSNPTINGSLQLKPPSLYSLQLSANTIVGGNNVIATARLDGVAAVNTVVTLSCPLGIANVPTSITVPAGKVAGAVSFNPSGVDATANTTLTATLGAVTQTASLSITKASFVSFGYSPATVPGGTAASGVLKLNGFAGPSGLTVNLSSPSASLVVPATAVFAAQTNTKSFAATTLGVDTSVAVNCTGVNGATTLHGVATVAKAVASSAASSPATISGATGGNVTVTLSLTGKTGPAGRTYATALTGGGTGVTLPASTTAAAQKNAVAVVAHVNPGASTGTRTVTFTAAGEPTVTATFTVN
ncbi:MAG: hypothetical protein ABUL72_06880, partial [Armatimonadota bacterium]